MLLEGASLLSLLISEHRLQAALTLYRPSNSAFNGATISSASL